MKENPASSRALRFAAESIPASATTTRSVTSCRLPNALSTGISVVASALYPSNRCISRGNPPGSTRSPTCTCGSTRCSLLIGDPAPVVLLTVLEVQGRHVIEHQDGPPARADRVRPRGRGQLPAVVAGLRAGQGPEQGPQTDRRCSDLLQDSHDLSLRCRLHDPCQDHRPEPVITQHVEPEAGVCAGQD